MTTEEIINYVNNMLSNTTNSVDVIDWGGSKEYPYISPVSKEAFEEMMKIKVETNPFYFKGRWYYFIPKANFSKKIELNFEELENDK